MPTGLWALNTLALHHPNRPGSSGTRTSAQRLQRSRAHLSAEDPPRSPRPPAFGSPTASHGSCSTSCKPVIGPARWHTGQVTSAGGTALSEWRTPPDTQPTEVYRHCCHTDRPLCARAGCLARWTGTTVPPRWAHRHFTGDPLATPGFAFAPYVSFQGVEFLSPLQTHTRARGSGARWPVPT